MLSISIDFSLGELVAVFFAVVFFVVFVVVFVIVFVVVFGFLVVVVDGDLGSSRYFARSERATVSGLW